MRQRHRTKERPPLLEQPRRPRSSRQSPPKPPKPRCDVTIEPSLYLQSMNSGTTLCLTLIDGSIWRGRVEWYDRDCLCLRREDGGFMVLFKTMVSQIAVVSES